MNSAEILTIGSELLQGSTLNSNAQFLGKQLTDLGFCVRYQTSCRDHVNDIIDGLDTAMTRSNLTIITGGLGPTPDDVTREAVAQCFNTDLVFHAGQYRNIKNYFKKTKHRTLPMTRREAFFPRAAKPIINHAGIAIGFYIETNRKMAVVLPGVPREMTHMFENEVRPLLTRRFKKALERWNAVTVSLTGLNEPQVMQRLGRRFFDKREFEFGIYPKLGWISIKLRSKDAKMIKTLKREMAQRLGKAIYAYSDEPIESEVSQLLRRSQKTVSAAESCTGGLIAKRLTDQPGASRYFKGGVLAYADSVKTGLLAVPTQTLHQHGAVSRQVAVLMARHVRKLLRTDYSVAVTGIAGPAGGSLSKPVGTVWVAVDSKNGVIAKEFLIGGDRDRIRQVSAVRALRLLHDELI